MTTSLANLLIAGDVAKLLDANRGCGAPDDERAMPRAQAEAVIHAALWAHGARSSSFAGGYAYLSLYREALGLKDWTFDEEEADCLHRFRVSRHYRQMVPGDLFS